jgi:hypothetical protein
MAPPRVPEVRRSKAIGILAQPAHALQLLCQHRAQEWDGAAEPVDAGDQPAGGEDEASVEEI